MENLLIMLAYGFGPILLGYVLGTWTYCNRNF